MFNKTLKQSFIAELSVHCIAVSVYHCITVSLRRCQPIPIIITNDRVHGHSNNQVQLFRLLGFHPCLSNCPSLLCVTPGSRKALTLLNWPMVTISSGSWFQRRSAANRNNLLWPTVLPQICHKQSYPMHNQ